MIDIILAAVACRLGDLVRGGTLGADKQNTATTRGDVAQRLEGGMKHRHGLLQVEDVDLVPLAEDVRLHPRVPATGAVSEMHASLKHLAHGKCWQRHRITPVLRFGLHAGNERPEGPHRNDPCRLLPAGACPHV